MPALSDPERLTSINLSGNAIADVSGLSSATNVTSLVLKQNALTDFPPLALPHLLSLDVSLNQIDHFPSGLSTLSALTSLVLKANPIATLTPDIAHLSTLEHLDCSVNQLTTLPDAFFQLDLLHTV